ncbi:MAG: hypothetical protein NC453_25865 [Muribaculum sp.]|nr:hypothetical protein [Muribaculum sp.]
MKKISIVAAFVAVLSVLTSCGGESSSTPLSNLCDVYAELAENKLEVVNAFGDVYRASGSEQQALQEKAVTLSKEMEAKNEALAQKAVELGEKLQGTEIPCEVSANLGFAIDRAVFATVNAQPNFANIVIQVNVQGETAQNQYVLMLDENGDVLDRTIGRCANNVISVNFRVTTDKGPQPARSYGAVRSLKIVTDAEYKGMKASDGDNAETDIETAEPEPAYTGESESTKSTESVTVNGVTITKGTNLAETLRKFNNITWDYNADFGVTATVGNVWITIDESDLTQKGQDIINAIPSDMENNIPFSVDYIKPSAKINQFESE